MLNDCTAFMRVYIYSYILGIKMAVKFLNTTADRKATDIGERHALNNLSCKITLSTHEFLFESVHYTK